jgi:hypothetical protein
VYSVFEKRCTCDSGKRCPLDVGGNEGIHTLAGNKRSEMLASWCAIFLPQLVINISASKFHMAIYHRVGLAGTTFFGLSDCSDRAQTLGTPSLARIKWSHIELVVFVDGPAPRDVGSVACNRSCFFVGHHFSLRLGCRGWHNFCGCGI